MTETLKVSPEQFSLMQKAALEADLHGEDASVAALRAIGLTTWTTAPVAVVVSETVRRSYLGTNPD